MIVEIRLALEARHEIVEKNPDLKFAVQDLRNVVDYIGRGGGYSDIRIVTWVHLLMIWSSAGASTSPGR